MPRPFTALQADENERFLDSLGRTGNVRMSAREAGMCYGTMQHRRRTHADLATRWEACVAAVNARLHLAGGKRGPEAAVIAGGAKPSRDKRGARSGGGLLRRCAPRNDGYRTKGGEPIVVRTKNGTLQVRLAHPDKLTRAAEQAFLRALAATANVRLSAAAAGASPAAFYRRRRQSPAFASEFRIALKTGYDRLEHAAMERTLQALHMDEGDEAWLAAAIAGNPLPPMSFEQAFQQLCFHRNTVRLDRERAPGRRAGIDPNPAAHLAAIGRNIDAIERAARFEASGSWRLEDEPPPPELPPLEAVTGWSKASGRPKHHPEVALFGGWRIEDMERRLSERAGSARPS